MVKGNIVLWSIVIPFGLTVRSPTDFTMVAEGKTLTLVPTPAAEEDIDEICALWPMPPTLTASACAA